MRDLYFQLIHLAESVFSDPLEIDWALAGVDMLAPKVGELKYADYCIKRDTNENST